MPKLTVSEKATPVTIEEFLHNSLPEAPLGYLHQLIKKGRVKRNHDTLEAGTLVGPGDCIQLPESQRILELLETPHEPVPPLEILFESREIVIVNKPAGLAVHASKGHEKRNLTDQIADYYGARKEHFQVSPIQRLDLETSGPVLFGKGKKSCSELGKLFMSGEVTKGYLALVAGKVDQKGRIISELPAKGKIKEAVSKYQAIATNKTASLLEVRLETGRQHQIRRQFAELGHPLYGDQRYHGPCPAQLPRLFLHCNRLAFINPFDGLQVEVSCPLPAELLTFLTTVKLSPKLLQAG